MNEKYVESVMLLVLITIASAIFVWIMMADGGAQWEHLEEQKSEATAEYRTHQLVVEGTKK